jgi:glutaredoxin
LITVYSKPDCPHCVRAKQLLSEYKFEYTELMIGKDVTRETVIEKFPGVKMVPIIIIGDNRLESVEELNNLLQNNMVESLL